MKTGIWQSHWLHFVNINLCAKNIKENLRFQNYQSITTVQELWAFLALPQPRKSGIWQFFCLSHINILLNYPIWLKTYGDFHILHFLTSALPWSKKSGIWQTYWLDLVSIYQYAKNYQNILNGLSAMADFANWPRTSRRTVGLTSDYRALFDIQPFNRSTFHRVVQYSHRFERTSDYHITIFLCLGGAIYKEI